MYSPSESEARSWVALKAVTRSQRLWFGRWYIVWDFDFDFTGRPCPVILISSSRDIKKLFLCMGASGTVIKDA